MLLALDRYITIVRPEYKSFWDKAVLGLFFVPVLVNVGIDLATGIDKPDFTPDLRPCKVYCTVKWESHESYWTSIG